MNIVRRIKLDLNSRSLKTIRLGGISEGVLEVEIYNGRWLYLLRASATATARINTLHSTFESKTHVIDGKVYIELTESIAEAGTLRCELTIQEDGARFALLWFFMDMDEESGGGEKGDPGQAATFDIVETKTGTPGSEAIVEEMEQSTAQNRAYILTVPAGEKGESPAAEEIKSIVEDIIIEEKIIRSPTIEKNLVVTIAEFEVLKNTGQLDSNTAYDVVEG